MTSEGRLRIVSWNCAGALHRKWQHVLALEPDIAIISESCLPERLGFPRSVEGQSTNSDWVGSLHFKGLGVFTFGDWRLSRLPTYDQRLEWILPLQVSGPVGFTLIAVWAMNHRSKQPIPPGWGTSQALAAADVYDLERIDGPVVITGDFNSAPVWDTPRRPRFANLISRYDRLQLQSAYHASTGERFGEESKPTHWWRERSETGTNFHIDYTFIPQDWVPAATTELGGFDSWCTQAGSDHAPIIVDIELAELPDLRH